MDKSFVGVYLRCFSDLLEPLDVHFSLHLISNKKSTERAEESRTVQFTTSAPKWGYGYTEFISHKDLLDNSKDLYITRRKIRIVGKIFYDGGISPILSKKISTLLWLKNLYKSMDHSDLIIKSTSGEEFKAHKTIICARSPVLSEMISYQMKENLSGVLELDDRSEVVKELIRFIYCGYFDNFDDLSDVDIDLYIAASRYELYDLKALCLKSIYKTFEVKNALETAGFAKMFNLKKLYTCCLAMIHA